MEQCRKNITYGLTKWGKNYRVVGAILTHNAKGVGHVGSHFGWRCEGEPAGHMVGSKFVEVSGVILHERANMKKIKDNGPYNNS